MSIQPGVGYTFTNLGGAFALTIDEAPAQNYTPPHPFKVFTTKTGSDYFFKVFPGTINNVEPTLNGTQLSNNPPPEENIGNAASPTLEYIYLQLPNSPGVFPDGPTVEHASTMPTADDTNGYILLATVDISDGKVTQNVSGSQWGERFKCGANTAEYFFSLI